MGVMPLGGEMTNFETLKIDGQVSSMTFCPIAKNESPRRLLIGTNGA